MAAALALAQRGVGRTGLNPAVGCIIVNMGCVVGRGWTQPGGRPHAEAVAIAQAGDAAHGATVYVTLEPCAHISERGPDCAGALLAAKPARVVIGITDPDPRTAGQGTANLRVAGIDVQTDVMPDEAVRNMAGYFSRHMVGRPFVTLKLATSLDGAVAMDSGESRWITGAAARAHGHIERARHDAILIGAGTYRADNPTLDVRLLGLEGRSPKRIILGSKPAPDGWDMIHSPTEISALPYNTILVEGGVVTAASFLRAGLVDRMLLYRAPILIGGSKRCLGDIGLGALVDAHGQWRNTDNRLLGKDQLSVYEKIR